MPELYDWAKDPAFRDDEIRREKAISGDPGGHVRIIGPVKKTEDDELANVVDLFERSGPRM
jgi:hypothetical protein